MFADHDNLSFAAAAAPAQDAENSEPGTKQHASSVEPDSTNEEPQETATVVNEAKEQANNFYSKIMDEAIRNLGQRGLEATSHIEFGKPGDVILRIAEDLKADLVVLGTNVHSALRRRFLGAPVDKVVDHAHCSVLIIKNGN